MDFLLPVIITTASGLVTLWIRSLNNRMNDLEQRLRKALSREEIVKEIEVRQESIKVLQQEIKEDIKEMRRTLEKLADKT